MNEEVFGQLLGEMIRDEFSVYDDPPKWKFSLKHRCAMKRIFARYEKNMRRRREKLRFGGIVTRETEPHKSRLSFKQRIGAVALVVFIIVFLAGCAAVASFISEKFHGSVRREYTLVNAVDIENSPEFIEYEYELGYVPDGFELTEKYSGRTNVYTRYKNETTGQSISLYQWVKSEFAPQLNTEYHTLETTDINGSEGLYIDFGDEETACSLLVWDNGDYIIEIYAKLDKESTLNLLNTHKFQNIL